MKKYKVGEILSTRKIGNIGKHSTLQDVLDEFGEPNYVRWDGLYFYNNLVFRINKINKKVASIEIWDNASLAIKPTVKIYKRLKSDIQEVINMQIEEVKNYLKSYKIEIFTNEDENNLPSWEHELYDNGIRSIIFLTPLIHYYPIENKYFTEKDPKFKITYDFDNNNIIYIIVNFNYRSKRRY